LIYWNEWNPMTLENAWAVLLAPVQILFTKTCGNIPKFSRFYDAPAEIQFTISILPALKALKSTLGALYHCPNGAYDDSTLLSMIDNFSVYAAVKATNFIFQNFYVGGDNILDLAKNDFKNLLDGLESFIFKYSVGQSEMIYFGGHIKSTEYIPVDTFASDAQIWGLLNMGMKKFDAQYGVEKAYKIWQKTVSYAGVFDQQKLLGVGYGKNTGIWSGELTWAAIIMCNKIGQEYINADKTEIGTKMKNDAKSMLESMNKKIETDIDGVYISGGLTQVDGSTIHVNKRYLIPWRWFANPIGSTAATSWNTFQSIGFNPFVLGGGADSVFFTTQCKDNSPSQDLLHKLAVYYNYDK